MANRRVLMLEGSNGHAFFLKETLLTDGLADQVDLICRAEQVVELMEPANCYDLVVINLAEAWEQGLALTRCLSRQAVTCPIILIVASDSPPPLPTRGRFITLFIPVSLRGFSQAVRAVMQTLDN
jgi:hypothetical protein